MRCDGNRLLRLKCFMGLRTPTDNQNAKPVGCGESANRIERVRLTLQTEFASGLISAHDSNNSRSSRVRLRTTLLSAVMIASAKSRLDFCSSTTFSSTVSRAIIR